MEQNVRYQDATTIRRGYDRWAVVYDHDVNPLPALEEPFMREQVGPVRGLSVLGLGCGTGRHARWLAEGGATVTAIDFSKRMFAEARAKCDPTTICFVKHDLPLPLEDHSFDLVVSGLVLEHLSDLNRFLRR